MNDLSPMQAKLVTAFRDPKGALRFDTDVSIDTIYQIMYHPQSMPPSTRQRQQRVGAIITKLNAKLNGMRVTPGQIKRTYRLERVTG